MLVGDLWVVLTASCTLEFLGGEGGQAFEQCRYLGVLPAPPAIPPVLGMLIN